MLDKVKVIKLEICTLKGQILLTATKNYTFPLNLIDSNIAESNQTIIIKGKNLPVLAKGAPVDAVIYTKAGDRIKYPAVIEVSTGFQLNVSLRVRDSNVLEERRRYYKVAAELPCLFTSITRDGKLFSINPPFPATILDINVGGVFLKADENLELFAGDIVEIVLEDPTGDAELASEILRVQRSPEGVVSGYGCRFLYLNTRLEEILAGFINRLQIQKRAIERAAAERGERYS
ncbi:MAG: PilZ domain-containing protein [Oscillospiraceae bacterium]|nr:PilZ domain-containing protein [Oscillospiraceae bacterium]